MTPPTVYLADPDVTLWHGDVLDVLRGMDADSVDCVVTSPPYWGLRDYGTGAWEGGDEDCDHVNPGTNRTQNLDKLGERYSGGGHKASSEGAVVLTYKDICAHCGARRVDAQLGLEPTPDAYVARMVAVFREVRRVLCPHGTCWVNLGDTFNSNPSWGRGESTLEGRPQDQIPRLNHTKVATSGLKPKDLVGIPWRVAFALQADGWWLRSAITWCKSNAMPESVTDRPSKATEMVFLLTKAPRYYYDAEAIRRPHQHDGRAVTRVVGSEGSLQHRDGERWPGSGANERDWWLIPTQPMSLRVRTSRRVRVEPDAGADGKKRTTSPDCPAHGDRGRQMSTASDGEHGAVASTRSARSDARHGLELPDGRAPTGPPLEPSSSHASSDSPALLRSPAATSRSSGSHRTGRDLATTEPCTPSAETAVRTERTSASHASSAPRPDTPASRTSPDGSAAHPSVGTHADSDCTCEWYVEHTENTSHFAAYPEELVRRCVLAGCPERVCRTCGKASERMTEQVGDRQTHGVNHVADDARGRHGTTSVFRTGRVPVMETLGWSDCGHNDWRPGLVLDPFVGSGTTCLVARNHGRHSVGIDLNEQYLALAARRLQQLSLLSSVST